MIRWRPDLKSPGNCPIHKEILLQWKIMLYQCFGTDPHTEGDFICPKCEEDFQNSVRDILKTSEVKKAERATKMPTEQTAIDCLFQAWQRLKELGWKEAIYCPKDGTTVLFIECGSTGIFKGHYGGQWPKGGWWLEDGHDLYPSHPTLFKAIKTKETP